MFAPVILPDSMLMALALLCVFIAPLSSLRSQFTSLFPIHPQPAAASAMNHWGLSAAAIGSGTVLFGMPPFWMHESTRRTPSRLKNRSSN